MLIVQKEILRDTVFIEQRHSLSTSGLFNPPMMAHPFGSGASLLDDLKGPNDGMQQLNSGFTSLSFSSTLSQGAIQKPDNVPMSPMTYTTMDNSLRSFVPQEDTPYYPQSPMSPMFRQQNTTPQMARTQSLGEAPQWMAPRNTIPAASPGVHDRRTFSPSLNTPVSLDGRSSQFSSGGMYQNDPLPSFLPPPPNLDTESSNQIGRLDQAGQYLSENGNQPPASPFVSTPRSLGNIFNEVGPNRERSLSTPGTYLRQSSFGANGKSSPAPSSNQILYEDKPTSWNEGPGFPHPRMYMEDSVSSPSSYDRFNHSRPPRHVGSMETQALLSPRIEMRHAASDGNFNFPSNMPIDAANPMSPIANNNHGHCQPNMPSGVIGSPSFDSTFQGGQINNDRHSFGSMEAFNPNPNTNFIPQYPVPRSSPMPPGIITSTPLQQQDNYFVQQQPPSVPGLQRHNSTGHNSHMTPHFLVNERGEIVGHASPVITHKTLEVFSQAPGEQRNMNMLPPTRPQRAQSYGGPIPGFNQIPARNQVPPPLFNPIPLQNDGLNGLNNPAPNDGNPIGSIGDGRGSIGDGRMLHQRNNTEPIPLAVMNPTPGANIHSVQLTPAPAPAPIGSFENTLVGEGIQSAEAPREETKVVTNVATEAVEEKAPTTISYASKLMAPRPEPAPVVSSPMTAGAALAKSGPRMVYHVKFKRSQRNLLLGPRVMREIKIGCYVKVEADRGEDMGIVMSIIPMEKFLASNRQRSMTEDSIASSGGEQQPSPASANIGDLKRIMRVATHDEISLLEIKREEEEELLKICRTKVRQRGLPMSVVDAEYQYDRNKLTFFFQAEGRIDFRELVRDLFSMYKTRIWMQQLDKNGSTTDETAEGGVGQ